MNKQRGSTYYSKQNVIIIMIFFAMT